MIEYRYGLCSMLKNHKMSIKWLWFLIQEIHTQIHKIGTNVVPNFEVSPVHTGETLRLQKMERSAHAHLILSPPSPEIHS